MRERVLIPADSALEVGTAGGALLSGVVSPFDFETFPRRVLCKAQIFLIPSTIPGRSGVFKTSD